MTSQQGVLFDLDGVVVMSEHLKAQSHSATVTAFGGDVPPEFYATIMGQSHDVVRRAFIGASGKSIDPNAYSDVYESDLHTRMRSDIRAAEGAPALLASLNEHNYALALVTSSLTWMMDLALSMTQTGQHFHTKICADDVQRHKPAPDAYLLALERLQLTRQAAVVIDGHEVAVEDIEGTDALLARVARLRTEERIRARAGRGVLVKAPKETQDLRFDLPATGLRTVEGVAKAGLAGMATVAGQTIAADLQEMIAAADRAGLFIVGSPP